MSFPDTGSFKLGDELSLDLMLLEENAILHVVDEATHVLAYFLADFHRASYGQSVDSTWLGLVEIGCTIYSIFLN